MAFGPSPYLSPLDFRISPRPLGGEQMPSSVVPAIEELYGSSQQIVRALIDYCGIGPQNPDKWPLLDGDPRTLLAGNLNRLYVKASENIVLGAAISFHAVAGALRVRNANATNNTRICDGFCCFTGGIAANAVGEVVLNNGVAPIAALTVGQRYWLGTVNGLISNVPAVAAGNVEQYLGIAISTTAFSFNAQAWIQH